MKPVVIFGTGHFAEVAYYYFTHDTERRVAAFTVDAPYMREPTLQGLPVVPFDAVERAFPPHEYSMFVALGPHGVNRTRAEKLDAAIAKGYEAVSYISSRAVAFPDLVYGPNTFVTEASWVMPFVRLGRNVAIWGATVAHHCIIGDHCTISVSTLAGGVEVGDMTFIGVNACVKERIRIGKRNIIGAGAVILLPTKDDAVHAVHHTRASRAPSRRLRVT